MTAKKSPRLKSAGNRTHGLFLALSLAFCAVPSGTTIAGQSLPVPQAPKVAAVFDLLLQQVRWPGGPAGERSLCLLGEDANAIALRQAGGSFSFAVRQLMGGSRDFSDCDALYIAGDSESDHVDLLESLTAQPVLTISSGSRFLDRGGMIGILGPGRAFYINQGAAWGAGLEFGSELYLEAANFALNDA